MVHSRDLLRWYGQERITTDLVFSVTRKPPNVCILEILHKRTPLSWFFSLLCHISPILYRSPHLTLYFTWNLGPFCPAFLKNTSIFLLHPIKPVISGLPKVSGSSVWIIPFDGWFLCFQCIQCCACIDSLWFYYKILVMVLMFFTQKWWYIPS